MTDETPKTDEAQAAEVPAVEEAAAPPAKKPKKAKKVDEAAEPVARQRPDNPNLQWYIVHTYSGFEERVKETLLQRADAHGEAAAQAQGSDQACTPPGPVVLRRLIRGESR